MGRIHEEYDPHILYQAINLTVELEYKIPMKRAYKILEKVEAHNKKSEKKISLQEVLDLMQSLGDSLEVTIDSENEEDKPSDGTSLQEKIKELLRLLGCHLTDAELNKILKGEVSLDDALSKKAKAAWMLIFDVDEKGKSRPNKDLVEQMMLCTQMIALENIEMKIQRQLIDRQIHERERDYSEGLLRKSDNLKTLFTVEKERNDPLVLDRKRQKLKLYIAHMQGYDRDRDRDGGRGVDMTTGEIIDFGDIYIADKEHGSIIVDIEHDGIDIADIR